MTNGEMDSIQIDNAPMLLERALTPGFKLLAQALVEATDRAGTGSDSQQGLSHFPHLMRAHPSHEHLCQSFSDMRFIATVALKGLGMELTFTISGDLDLLEPTRRCGQITAVGAVAIAFTLGTAFSPCGSNEGI